MLNYRKDTDILKSGHAGKEMNKEIFNQILCHKRMVCENQYPIEIFGLEEQNGGVQQLSFNDPCDQNTS